MLIGKRPSKDFKKSLKSCSLNFEILRKDPELNSEQNCVEIGPDYFVALFWDLFSVCWKLFPEDLSLATEL